MGGGRWMAHVALALGSAALGMGLAGCSPVPVTVVARPVTPVAKGEIRRIAVLPFTTTGLVLDKPERGVEPLSEPPGDTVTRAMTTAMRNLGDWQIVDDLTVGEGLRQLAGDVRAPSASEAVAVGKLLRVDAVLRGHVKVFEERIGSELAVKRPAHVVFAAELLRPADGAVLWQGEYDEQQQSLSENLLNLPGFVRAHGTWVRAGDLTAMGATRMADRLHEALYGPPHRRAGSAKKTR